MDPFTIRNNSYSGNDHTAYHAPDPSVLIAAEEALRKQREEAERREMNLNAREERVRQLEAQYQRSIENAPNWPSCKPMLFHDIDVDVPQDGRSLIRKLYFTWYFCCWCYLFNLVASIVVQVSGGDGPIIGAILAFVIGIPSSWTFWYRQAYYGAKNKSSLSFVIFFFNIFLQIIAAGLFCVGIFGCGILTAMKELGPRFVAGIFCVISAVNFGLFGFFCLGQMRTIHVYYKKNNMNVQQAQNEAATTIAKSETGQRIAVQAARSAVTQNR